MHGRCRVPSASEAAARGHETGHFSAPSLLCVTSFTVVFTSASTPVPVSTGVGVRAHGRVGVLAVTMSMRIA